MQHQKLTIIKQVFVQGIKIPNLSLNVLKLVEESRGIKGYKSMSKDRLLSDFNASESVEESETMPDPTKINKTIRDIRKENRDEDKILRDLRFLLDPTKAKRGNAIKERDTRALFESDEDDCYKPIKTSNAFNSNYIEHETNGDTNKYLSIEEYLNKIRPYLSDMINDLKMQGE